MIWISQEKAGGGWLENGVAAALAGAAPERPELAREAVRTVEAFIRDRHPGQALGPDYLLLLIARALWAVGEEAAARRFVEAKGAEWRVAPGLAGAATAADLSVPSWRILLGSRALQAGDSLARGAIWILDLRRLLDGGRGALELAVFRALNAIVDRLGAVWDATRGEGILGLRNLDATAAVLLGRPPRCRQSLALGRELRERCELRLAALRQRRGWTAAPDVISL